jgi:hypothetical protein
MSLLDLHLAGSISLRWSWVIGFAALTINIRLLRS